MSVHGLAAYPKNHGWVIWPRPRIINKECKHLWNCYVSYVNLRLHPLLSHQPAVFVLTVPNSSIGLYGTGALEGQQYAVYSDLAEVLETDFTGGNKVLTQLSNFYDSCITAQMMNETEFVDRLVPIIRKFYQQLGTYSYSDYLEWNNEIMGGQIFACWRLLTVHGCSYGSTCEW